MVTTNNTIRNIKKFPINPIRVRVEVGGGGRTFLELGSSQMYYLIWFLHVVLSPQVPNVTYYVLNLFPITTHFTSYVCPKSSSCKLITLTYIMWLPNTSQVPHTHSTRRVGVVMVVGISRQNLIKGNWFIIISQIPMFLLTPGSKSRRSII